jgi:hypothetical protein
MTPPPEPASTIPANASLDAREPGGGILKTQMPKLAFTSRLSWVMVKPAPVPVRETSPSSAGPGRGPRRRGALRAELSAAGPAGSGSAPASGAPPVRAGGEDPGDPGRGGRGVGVGMQQVIERRAAKADAAA